VPGVRLDCSGVQLSWSNTLAGVDGQDWFTPFGDPIVQVDCDVCGKRLADVADLGVDLALVDRAELRRGRDRKGPGTQQAYAEMGLRAVVRQHGPGQSSALWRFECRCGAAPVRRPERLIAEVKASVAKREHRLRLR